MRKVKTFKIYQFFMIKENAQVLGDEFLQHYFLRTWKVWSLRFWMLYLKLSWDNFSWFYRFKRTVHISKKLFTFDFVRITLFSNVLGWPNKKIWRFFFNLQSQDITWNSCRWWAEAFTIIRYVWVCTIPFDKMVYLDWI